ncbi:MAG TPA: bifunctional glutamate N-acetyltransferase/amino-acid acetyltransferase ArgJ [Acidimicrobiia bacterium]|nr:bifunctional glutamate N-acetyltransferase/amino-acid acetyltransferase ArgJ [Acidimicrobiia bacterium]
MSVTAAAGFLAAGVAAGIKPAGDPDMALVVGTPGTIGAAVFTTNRAAAPPVQLSRAHLASGPSVRAVVLNSGCANAGTGEAGYAVARETAGAVALALACDDDEVIVCSTGPIGPHIDAAILRRGVGRLFDGLAGGAEAGASAAAGILTTDTVIKEAQARSGGFVVGGMAKGAGMVRPDMATMLAVVTTDAVVTAEAADHALRAAVDESFHSLNVDGCASTNDTVALLVSGASGVAASPDMLLEPLRDVCRSLAHQMAEDAEGASRVVQLHIRGASDAGDARTIGRSVADSVLVRSSFFGGDPNWGRILGALGAAPVEVDPNQVAVAYAGVTVAKDGVGVGYDHEALVAALGGDFSVDVKVGDGPGAADILTTDLTPDYVIFNGEPS